MPDCDRAPLRHDTKSTADPCSGRLRGRQERQRISSGLRRGRLAATRVLRIPGVVSGLRDHDAMTTTDHPRPTERQLPAWADTVGPGWTPCSTSSTTTCSRSMPSTASSRSPCSSAACAPPSATASKKANSTASSPTVPHALTDVAVTASEHTCEASGSPGHIRPRGDGQRTWMSAGCDACHTLVPPHPAAAHTQGRA